MHGEATGTWLLNDSFMPVGSFSFLFYLPHLLDEVIRRLESTEALRGLTNYMDRR